MITARAKTAWLAEPGARLDAAYHLSEGRQAKIHIDAFKGDAATLSGVTKSIFSGARFRRHYVKSPDFGIPLLGGADTQKADFAALKFISKKLTPAIDKLKVEVGWTLLSRSGTIGLTSYTNEDFLKKAVSEDLIRVVPNTDKILSGYLYAFLTSKQGYALLTQSTYGGVIQHIEPHHIADLPVPLLPDAEQQQIHEQIEEASRLRVEANRALREATTYFDGLFPAYDKGYNVAFTKGASKLGFSLAARNNEKYADLLDELIRQRSHVVLNSVAVVHLPPIFKHIYLKKDNGHPFFTGAHLSNNYREKDRFLSPKGVVRIGDYKIEKDWTLVYCSGPRDGMLGQVFTADNTLVGSCLSNHVIRVKIEDKQLSNLSCMKGV